MTAVAQPVTTGSPTQPPLAAVPDTPKRGPGKGYAKGTKRDPHAVALTQETSKARRAVETYLRVVVEGRGGRTGPRKTKATEARLAKVCAELAAGGKTMDVMRRLTLLAEKERIEARHSDAADDASIEEARAGFHKYAKLYADRAGVSWSVFRACGAAAADLKAAGIKRDG